jgi:hypothetical protein
MTDSVGEIFKSPIPCDPSKLPTDLSVPDYLFQKLNKLLPQVADNPWLVRYFVIKINMTPEFINFLIFSMM